MRKGPNVLRWRSPPLASSGSSAVVSRQKEQSPAVEVSGLQGASHAGQILGAATGSRQSVSLIEVGVWRPRRPGVRTRAAPRQ